MSDKTPTNTTPRHVAIIMDGNGRWAQKRGRPRLYGHHAGARRVREIVEACPDLGIKYLTVFAFSTENWKRTQAEVSGLMAATKRLAREVAAGRIDPEKVDAETLAKFLDTYVLPDPDLVIRTSGEARISNFLLWQSAYSEYEFIDTLWPDFTAKEFARVVRGYNKRERRYGAVPG